MSLLYGAALYAAIGVVVVGAYVGVAWAITKLPAPVINTILLALLLLAVASIFWGATGTSDCMETRYYSDC